MLLLETALIFIIVLIKILSCSINVSAYQPPFKSQHGQELLSSKPHYNLAFKKNFELLLPMKLEERK